MLRSCSSSRGRGRRRRASGFGVALLVLSNVACATLTIPQEQQLGEQLARDTRGKLDFVEDRAIVEYVRSIGDDIVQASGPHPFIYRFYVVENQDINAFAMPAGYIYIHTGTILRARNVSELAGVIAHEIGHVEKRHIARNYNRQRNTGLLYQLAVAAASYFGGGAMGSAAQLGGQLAAVGYLNKFGRDAERESDAFAVQALPKAGYDPNGLVTFFETLQSETGGGGGGFLSSHPGTGERIQNTRGLIAALPPYEGLRVTDRGKLEIIQSRIMLLTGRIQQQPQAPPPPQQQQPRQAPSPL